MSGKPNVRSALSSRDRNARRQLPMSERPITPEMANGHTHTQLSAGVNMSDSLTTYTAVT